MLSLFLFSKGATASPRSIKPLERRHNACPSLDFYSLGVNYECVDSNSGPFCAGSINTFCLLMFILGTCDLNSVHQLTDGRYVPDPLPLVRAWTQMFSFKFINRTFCVTSSHHLDQIWLTDCCFLNHFILARAVGLLESIPAAVWHKANQYATLQCPAASHLPIANSLSFGLKRDHVIWQQTSQQRCSPKPSNGKFCLLMLCCWLCVRCRDYFCDAVPPSPPHICHSLWLFSAVHLYGLGLGLNVSLLCHE